ncbi:MAG TPA: hypothetical protein VEC16_07230 [Alphaproteobacteria bacterium]|nr:hypothetical protein [Alphaproteobacteria bacterium]
MVKNYIHKTLAGILLAGSLMFSNESYSQFTRSDYSTYTPPVYDVFPSRFDKRLEKEKKTNKTSNKKDKYALLIAGENDERFMRDISLIYQILLELDFKKENIYILDEYGRENLIYPSDTTATRENIKKILSHLETKIDSNDIFLTHITTHGAKILDTRKDSTEEQTQKKQSVYDVIRSEHQDLMWNYLRPLLPEEFEFLTALKIPGVNYNYKDYFTELEFEESYSKIKPGLGIFTTGACYGAAFAKIIANKKNFVGIASSKIDQEATIKNTESFPRYLYGAFRNIEEADTDKNNKISIDEIFEYAKKKQYSVVEGIDDPMIFPNNGLRTNNLFLK